MTAKSFFREALINFMNNYNKNITLLYLLCGLNYIHCASRTAIEVAGGEVLGTIVYFIPTELYDMPQQDWDICIERYKKDTDRLAVWIKNLEKKRDLNTLKELANMTLQFNKTNDAQKITQIFKSIFNLIPADIKKSPESKYDNGFRALCHAVTRIAKEQLKNSNIPAEIEVYRKLTIQTAIHTKNAKRSKDRNSAPQANQNIFELATNSLKTQQPLPGTVPAKQSIRTGLEQELEDVDGMQQQSNVEAKKQFRKTLEQGLVASGKDITVESRFIIACALHDMPAITKLLPQIKSKAVIENGAKTARDSRSMLEESDAVEILLKNHLEGMDRQAQAAWQPDPALQKALSDRWAQSISQNGGDLGDPRIEFRIAAGSHNLSRMKELLPRIDAQTVVDSLPYALGTAANYPDFKQSGCVAYLEDLKAQQQNKGFLKHAIDKLKSEKKQAKLALKQNSADASAQPSASKPEVEKSGSKKKKKKKKQEKGDQEKDDQSEQHAPQDQNNKPASSTSITANIKPVSYTQALGAAQQKENEELEDAKKELLKGDPKPSAKQLAMLKDLPRESLNHAQRRALHKALSKADKEAPAASSAGIPWPTGPSLLARSAANNESQQSVQKPSKPSKPALNSKLLTNNPYDLPKEYFPPNSNRPEDEEPPSTRAEMELCRRHVPNRPLPELSSSDDGKSGDDDDKKNSEDPANMDQKGLAEHQRRQYQQWVTYKTADGRNLKLNTKKLIDGTQDGKGGHFRGPDDERTVLYESGHGSIVERRAGGITTCFAPGVSPKRIIGEIIPNALDHGEITSFEEQPGGIVVVGLRQEAHKPGQDPRYPQDIQAVIDSKNGKVLTVRPDLPLRRLK